MNDKELKGLILDHFPHKKYEHKHECSGCGAIMIEMSENPESEYPYYDECPDCGYWT